MRRLRDFGQLIELRREPGGGSDDVELAGMGCNDFSQQKALRFSSLFLPQQNRSSAEMICHADDVSNFNSVVYHLDGRLAANMNSQRVGNSLPFKSA